MIEILFKAEVRGSDRRAFLEFIEWDARVAEDEERESGTLCFDYFEDPHDSNVFFVYEAYRDEVAFDAHKRNAPFKRWESHIKPNILTEFQILFERVEAVPSSTTLAPHDEATLKSLNERFVVLEQQRDAEAKAWFNTILSDHLIFRRADGSMVDKQAFLKSLDNPNRFLTRHMEDAHIIALGDRALVFLVVRTTEGDGAVNRYRNIRLFSKQPNTWMLQRWYNYELIHREWQSSDQVQLSYLWDEYKYRHGLCWQAVYKVTAAVFFLAGLPYVQPELTNNLGWFVLAPAILGTVFAVFGVYVVNNELKLFSYAKVAHNKLRKQFIKSVVKNDEISGRITEDLNPDNARRTLFDIYVHVLLIMVCILSAGNALFLGISRGLVYCLFCF
ncbi:MAG: DUF4440 domain-containing protein [Nitrospira sp. CR2.1]|nr:DUF4440 domain-containing protein [Nitrospira sp. CR2.1]MBA5876082.1 DUF4440 domain-containing protein [Nitrospira sp. CR1.2]